MSWSLGGLAILYPYSPFLWLDNIRTGLRSFLFVLLVLAFLLILAYLTNPTEISFRAYLTEQSFRQHLTHLDDLTDDSASEPDASKLCPRAHSLERSASLDRATLPFHFANRASVSLRTPKHVFHSFGICTLATTRGAAVPPPGRRASTSHSHRSDLESFVSSDSWFIGAFGRWWRGGPVESCWYYDAMIRSKDPQAWSSGILGFKALDKFHDYNANDLPFAKFAPCPRPLLRGSPPKLRNRERSTQRPDSIPRRTSSPPPLPKSASLPLHADHRLHDFLPVAPQSSHTIAEQKRIALHAPPVAHTISRTSSASAMSGHSPIIAEVLRQIAAAQTSIQDLQNQLEEAQNTANQSRDSFEAELADLRSRRREEDQKRADGRARIKTLEEARRLAETSKREAERKMKHARNAKDSAIHRVEELESEIQGLKQRTEDDHALLATEPDEIDRAKEQELICELEKKKKEARIAEEVVAALNMRARELEDKIDESKSRLRTAQQQHRARLAKAYLNSAEVSRSIIGNGNVVHQGNFGQLDNSTWSSSYNPFDVPVDDVLVSPVVSERVRIGPRSESKDALRSPDLAGLSSVLRAQSYTVFDDDTACVDSASLSRCSGQGQNGYFQAGQAIPFSPFRDPPTPSAAFIPKSLISVLDSPSADLKGGFGIQSGLFTSSPIEYGGHSKEAESEFDASDLGHAQGQTSYDRLYQNITPYETHGPEDLEEAVRKGAETPSTGWSPTPRNEKQRSGLNPDAKVFHLTRLTSDKTDSTDTSTCVPSYDALNPTGVTSRTTSSTPSSLLRAFAPSRAEREALQRALGGSTNTSLERLPSLSDVGSIPSSPVPPHAAAKGKNVGEVERALPAWLQSLPLIRKPNFSPWEDEELVPNEAQAK